MRSTSQIRGSGPRPATAEAPLAAVAVRFRYNQDFDSIYAMVPATIALLLA